MKRKSRKMSRTDYNSHKRFIQQKFKKTVALAEQQRDEANNLGILESELQRVERQIRELVREQKQLLQWALKGFPEETVEAENKLINERRNSDRCEFSPGQG